MSFLVRVAVLPVQIVLTVPIVSHASKFLTSKLSYFMVSIEYAREIDTAKGSPSGTATIMMVSAVVKKSNSLIRVSP